jgi:hypothetical protein
LNGEYRGLYVLTEKIKRNANRVNISKNSFVSDSVIDITGGYILSMCNQYVYPKSERLTSAQSTYIQGFLDEIYSTLKKHSLGDSETGFRKYID